MYKSNKSIIESLKGFMDKAVTVRDYIAGEQDFTRSRKLPFKKLVVFIINLVKRTLSIELHDYFEKVNAIEDKSEESCTKGAFSQSRMKLSHKFFIDWNKTLVREYYSDNDSRIKRWEKYRLMAVDGSTLYLINRKDVKEEFGVQTNEKVERPMSRILCCYDVLNNICVKAEMMRIDQSELPKAIEWLDSHEKDMLMLYDRAFPDFGMLYLSLIKSRDFVIRSPKRFTNEIRSFLESKDREWVVELPSKKTAIKKLKRMGYQVNKRTKIKVRLIKVNIGKEDEILVTSLVDTEKYPIELFKELYHKRWGIETYYDRLKNKLQMELFTGHTPEAIKQDFHAMIFISNLQSLIINEAEESLSEINERRQYNYHVNRNVSLGLMKNEIVELFLSSKPEKILERLKNKFIKYLEPDRPERVFPRIIKSKRRKGKYQTYTNYRRAI